MEDFGRGSLLLPVMALIVGFFVLFGWLLAVEFRLYRLTRFQCPACGVEMTKGSARCGSCGEAVR